MIETFSNTGYLTGQLLVAMPSMRDARFIRSLIYICAHNAEGAMGLVLNRLIGSVTFPDLLQQIGIDTPAGRDIRVHFGGPVETGRGFVLHSTDYLEDGTMLVSKEVALTATVDILKDIAGGEGPRDCLLALGYAGWGPGQLDAELQSNGWLAVSADSKLLFDDRLDTKWDRALKKLGIDLVSLSDHVGHA